jgi:tetratricopeptide (TPR) repeat protein
MMRISRSVLRTLIAGIVVVALAAPAMAQTGGVRGRVVDQAGKPVEGAEIVIQSKESNRKHALKSGKKGEFVQIGIFPGQYTITATKDGLGTTIERRIGIGDPEQFELQLAPPQPSDDQRKKLGELQQLFGDGVNLTRAEKYDEAIAKFEQAAALVPSCNDCYYNMGYAYIQKKDLDKAAAAYEKAAELKPDHVETWNALAAVYTQQQKHDKAMEAMNKVTALAGTAVAGAAGAGGANATALYNQGVIFWNQQKYAEAKDKFEAAIQADPKHGEAQFRLGTAYLNLNDVPKAVAAFEEYLQIAPTGPHADEAKQFIEALKQK